MDRDMLRRFVDTWQISSSQLTSDQENEIAILYIKDVLGFGEVVARQFVDSRDNVFVGAVGLPTRDRDTVSFWEYIIQLAPGDYKADDLKALVAAGPFLAFMFICGCVFQGRVFGPLARLTFLATIFLDDI